MLASCGMKGLFVGGTDTGVGKTIVSAALLTRASSHYQRIAYHKPIQTGVPDDSDKNTVSTLISPFLPPPPSITHGIALKKPLSPHLAAHYQKHYIEFLSVIEDTKKQCIGDFNIIEGAGGLMVPINNRYLMIDLIKNLSVPCVLVVRSTLGTINHTLLSLEALKRRGIPVKGVIMMGKNDDNYNSIRFYGRVKNIISLPHLAVINHESLRSMVLNHIENLDKFLIG
jgi:dethiobiotin synthetase